MSKHVHPRTYEYEPGCLQLPRFERVNYFYGQMLGVREFQSEQSFFLEKHRLHNRYLHGYGVVCGLNVKPCDEIGDPCGPKPERPPTGQHPPPKVPPKKTEQAKGAEPVKVGEPPPPPQHEPQQQPRDHEHPDRVCLEIDCGLALDCQGNEIVVPWPKQIDLLEHLDCKLHEPFFHGRQRAWITVCFHERKVDPVRPITVDSCGGIVPDCVPSRLRDDYCIKVKLERPPHDTSCSPCDRSCCDPCLLLAEVWWDGRQLRIDDSARRSLAPFVPTRIANVSWIHDADYRPEVIDDMLEQGLTIHFTDDVLTSTLRRGVFDVWVIQGGSGRHGDIYSVGVDVVVADRAAKYSKWVTVKTDPRRNDNIDPGDRVLVQFRSAAVLDRCCRPIDGENTGGSIPLHPDANWPVLERPEPLPCVPRPFGPATSGNGVVAGNFESWFYASDGDKE